MAIEVKTKKWGNSIGIIIPSETIEKLRIKPEERIVIQIERKTNVLKEMFGILKSKKSAKQMIQEARKELESKWMR
ncbi:MAG: hypothetical protein AABX10_01725 [Nanoarchaeota archaeon]